MTNTRDMDREAFERIADAHWPKEFALGVQENGLYVGVTIERAWEIYQAALTTERARLLPVLEMARDALNEIAAGDIAYLVCPKPIPKGYPGRYGQIARSTLTAINEVLGKE